MTTTTQETISPHQGNAVLGRKDRRARLIASLAIVGSGTLDLVDLPFKLAFADVFLSLMMISGVGVLFRSGGGPFRYVFRRELPFLWLLAVASFMSLFGVGLPFWTIDHGTRDLLTLAAFAFLGAYLWRRRRIVDDLLNVSALVGILAASTTLLASTTAIRESGVLFSNPNYAAHFIATAIVLTAFSHVRTVLKLIGIAILLAGMVPTGSFGGASVLVGAVIVLLYRRLAVLGPGARSVGRLLLILVIGYVGYMGATAFSESDVDLGKGVSSARLERSGDTRLAIWSDAIAQLRTHPAGLGPHGLKMRNDIDVRHDGESHNDYVAFLVETGPLGLIAFLGIAFVIWRSLPIGGGARVLMAGLALSACFREIVNFRHVWLALVLLALRDFNELDQRDSSSYERRSE